MSNKKGQEKGTTKSGYNDDKMFQATVTYYEPKVDHNFNSFIDFLEHTRSTDSPTTQQANLTSR